MSCIDNCVSDANAALDGAIQKLIEDLINCLGETQDIDDCDEGLKGAKALLVSLLKKLGSDQSAITAAFEDFQAVSGAFQWSGPPACIDNAWAAFNASIVSIRDTLISCLAGCP